MGTLSLIMWWRMPKPGEVEQFGPIKVGGRLPGFSGVSQSGIMVGPTRPRSGRFYVHVIDEQLPPACLDLECGEQARAITRRGGHLIGGSDYKGAKGFGVKVIKTSSLTRRVLYHVPPLVDRLIGRRIRRDFWTFETSLVVVVNCEGRIVRIYKNAGIKDVPRLVSNLEDSELCPP